MYLYLSIYPSLCLLVCPCHLVCLTACPSGHLLVCLSVSQVVLQVSHRGLLRTVTGDCSCLVFISFLTSKLFRIHTWQIWLQHSWSVFSKADYINNGCSKGWHWETSILKKNDTSPDPDPEWFFGCLIKCNRKCTTLPVLPTSVSITLIWVKVSELQIKAVCIWERREFYIMWHNALQS